MANPSGCVYMSSDALPQKQEQLPTRRRTRQMRRVWRLSLSTHPPLPRLCRAKTRAWALTWRFALARLLCGIR
jgi:hypothetical protein